MSITEKRRQLVSFSDRYYRNVVCFVARKGSGFGPALHRQRSTPRLATRKGLKNNNSLWARL